MRLFVRPSLSPARARHWLRGVLLCMLFASLHSTVGAWLVPAISQAPVVQVCTSQGMQWVAIDEAPEDGAPVPIQNHACVWAAAHVALTETQPPVHGQSSWDSASRHTAAPCAAAPPRCDHAWRVLLSSAMRAPPVCAA